MNSQAEGRGSNIWKRDDFWRCNVDGGISRTEKVTYRCPQNVLPMRKQAGSCSRFG